MGGRGAAEHLHPTNRTSHQTLVLTAGFKPALTKQPIITPPYHYAIPNGTQERAIPNPWPCHSERSSHVILNGAQRSEESQTISLDHSTRFLAALGMTVCI